MTNSKKSVKSKKLKCKILILWVCVLLLAGFSVSLYISNACIKVTHFTLESDKIVQPVRLAVISDMHSKEFANNNEDLYSKLEKAKPDLILTVGDMISKKHTDTEGLNYLEKVLAEFCKIAPVYYSLGNHERHSDDLAKIITSVSKSGAVLLEHSYSDITIHGNNLRLFGLSHYYSWHKEANDFISACLQGDTDTFSLFLCHNPEFYIWGVKNYTIDLMLSGHTHGGMLKLPLIGPAYAPDQGFFPEYGAGFFEEENLTLAVTTGLGSSPEYMPRVFNRPEIMIIDVK